MVLQQNVPAPVWGWADEGETVKVMDSDYYPKRFFDSSAREIVEWLDAQYGKDGWIGCGHCHTKRIRNQIV